MNIWKLFDFNVLGKSIMPCYRNQDDGGDGGDGAGGGGDTGGSFDVGTMLAEDGSFTDSFQESVPKMLGEGYEDAKIDYKDIPGLLKGVIDTKRAFHAKTDGMVKLPGEDATDEDRAAYREAMGIPDAADNYKFERADLPDGREYDQEGEKMFKEVFHQLGVSGDQADGLVKAFDQYEESIVTKMAEQQVADSKAANEAFDQKHGENAEKVRRLAGEAMQKTGFTENVLKHIEGKYPELQNDPVLVNWFSNDIVKKMLPGHLHDGDGGGDGGDGADSQLKAMYPNSFNDMKSHNL